MGKIYQVVVYGWMVEAMMIDLCNTEEQFRTFTVAQLKERIAQRLPGDAGEALRLSFAGKALDGDSTKLTEYGIEHKSSIHMTMILVGGLTA